MTGFTTGLKSSLYTLIGAAVLFAVWKFAASLIGAEILLPAPERVAAALFDLVAASDFRRAVGATVVRGISGFSLSAILGLFVGVVCGLSPIVFRIVRPLLAVIRSTPVMSVIILALIWFSTDSVPVFVSFLTAFPIITGNVMEGVGRTDSRLLEMARVFQVSPRDILIRIHLPSLFPYFLAGMRTALGITWKVVVAAEVLSQPDQAVGTGLQIARMQLETADVFAWTAVAVLLSFVTEFLFEHLTSRASWLNPDKQSMRQVRRDA